ncbi:hypothetical protein AKG11_32390 [Shinella sp. SUS2]|nr:hypothetical protein AKG11_32390 [Shinella sp. SUS2]KOC71609.1 hypothetical protein AKG10_32050 [Shinella sp. GWS1]
MTDVRERSKISETSSRKLVFSGAEEDEELQIPIGMLDYEVVGSPQVLPLPIQDITVQTVSVLGTISRLMFRNKEPY